MENIAVHMRVSGITVTNEDVSSRRTAASSLGGKWGKETSVTKILAKVAEVAEALGGDGIPSATLGNEVQAAIQKKSAAYLYEERPLEVGVCAGMAVVSIISGQPSGGGWTIADVYASALWSALSFQPVLEDGRREKLRDEVLRTATDWAGVSAEKARERHAVPDPLELTVTLDADSATTSNFKEALSHTVEALRRNAALDREELDFLWWAQLNRSRLLDRQLSAISEPTRILAAGIEGASMLRRLPCQVHREIVLRTLDEDPELNLEELLDVLGEDRTMLGAPFREASPASHPTVFPLLNALATGEIEGNGTYVKRRVSEWGGRVLLEAGLSRMASRGVGKL
ncbi:GTPase-associated system all-helical protein GASH [Stutzerimonas chloritidismutans]